MDEKLSTLITQSMGRLLNQLEQTAPTLHPPINNWMRSLAGGLAPEAYFKHPLAFPTLLLPWWIEQSFGVEINLSLHADIAYSSINGYYFIRILQKFF